MTLTLGACATSHPAQMGQVNSPNTAFDGTRSGGLAGSGDPAVQRLLAQMEEQWARAAVRSDSSTIGRMVAPEYFSVGRDGVADRAQVLSDFASSNPDFTQLNAQDSGVVVRVYGDMAVVTAIGNNAVRSNKNGLEYRNQSRYVETWIRRDGAWQVVAGAYPDMQWSKETMTPRLLRAEQDYADMVNKRDTLAFERLVSDSITFASGTDSVETKAQLWKDIKSSQLRTNVHHVDRAYVSADVGTVNGTIDRTFKDGSTMRLRYADTWVNWGGNWRLIARQLVPATDGH
jgi:hypothetical protein